MEKKFIERDGVKLAYLDEGQGPAVFLIHGYPDSSDVWRHQIPMLLAAGYRVIAPDIRGYGDSAVVEGVDAYIMDEVCSDFVAILDECSVDKAAVIGHDWGAILAWVLVDRIGERASCFATLAVGAPQCYAHCDDIRQKEMGWYTLLFQMEQAEQILSANDWKMFRQLIRHHEEVEHWIADMSREGRMTSMLNLYRANILSILTSGKEYVSVVPTLGLWSEGDHFLVEEQMISAGRYVKGPWRYERVENAGHWMMLDRPDHINRLLKNFLMENVPV